MIAAWFGIRYWSHCSGLISDADVLSLPANPVKPTLVECIQQRRCTFHSTGHLKTQQATKFYMLLEERPFFSSSDVSYLLRTGGRVAPATKIRGQGCALFAEMSVMLVTTYLRWRILYFGAIVGLHQSVNALDLTSTFGADNSSERGISFHIHHCHCQQRQRRCVYPISVSSRSVVRSAPFHSITFSTQLKISCFKMSSLRFARISDRRNSKKSSQRYPLSLLQSRAIELLRIYILYSKVSDLLQPFTG